jgi:putative ABC transport system permease protein
MNDITWIDGLVQDLRIGLRALKRQPGFSLAAICTFALGIGAATAIFSVAYGIAFRPLPYPAADRLVRIYESNRATAEPKLLVSEGVFHAWREEVTPLERLALFGPARMRFTSGDSPQPITMMAVSPAFFDVLGVGPVHGRTFKPESEYGRGKTDELVISYEAWERLFGGDVNILGRAVPLVEGDGPFVIAGVMPRGFVFEEPVEAWRPLAVDLPIRAPQRSTREERVIARLRPDATVDQLRAELDLVSARLAEAFPNTNAGWTTTVEPLRDAIIGRFGQASWLLLAAVAAVVLLACANVAGLIAARAIGRVRETSVRIALGASRAGLVQLWVSEALILALGGAALGVTLAWWLVQLLRTAAPPGLPRLDDIAVDLTALSVAAAATILSAIVCALVPALGARDDTPLKGLRSGSARSSEAHGRRRVSTGLVAIQCGTALALVALTLVFARSFMKLTAVDLGWQPANVLSLNLTLLRPSRQVGQSFYTQWAQRLMARLETTPGITRAAVTSGIPFSPANVAASIGRGPTAVADETRWPITLHSVSEGYFQTLGLTLRRGRLFTSDDRFDEPTLAYRSKPTHYAAIVSESVAHTLWPGQDPLGQQFHIPSFGFASFLQVVGVVADVQFAAVGQEPVLDVFLPWMQFPFGGAVRLVVRATDNPAAIAPLVRDAVLAEHPVTGIHSVTPLVTLADRSIALSRVTSQLVAGLGLLALVLAAVGVYGGLSTIVRARAHETAVRIALGASPANTLWRTVVQGLTPVIVGAIGGIGAAMVLMSSARSLLFQIAQVDVGSLLVGALVVLTVTLVACIAAALRATQIDPVGALKAD